ncbi:MAG: cytochrome P460 family protein [Proteobacteria bacterium]|nr:cytochrome P460 family protein [Pseudomonadota bacterium]
MPKLMMALIVAGVLLAAGRAGAGPDLVRFPADYKTRFVQYNAIERPDRKPAVVRFFYASPAAAAAAKAGQPIPDGTVLVMEDRKVKLNEAGQPSRGADGRYLATDEVVAIFVQEKRNGWGEAYPASKRNGEWEYSSFGTDGAVRANLNTDGCFTCHLNRKERDYTFTFFKWVLDGKP